MSPAQAAIIVLSVIGTTAEGAGIVLVAGRREDLGRAIREGISVFGARVRSNHRRLTRLLWRPPIPFPQWILRLRTVHTTGVVTVRASAEVEVRRVMGGPLDQRIQRLDDELYEVRARVEKIEAALPERIRQETKDSWPGLALLFTGLSCTLAAGIIGAAASG